MDRETVLSELKYMIQELQDLSRGHKAISNEFESEFKELSEDIKKNGANGKSERFFSLRKLYLDNRKMSDQLDKQVEMLIYLQKMISGEEINNAAEKYFTLLRQKNADPKELINAEKLLNDMSISVTDPMFKLMMIEKYSVKS